MSSNAIILEDSPALDAFGRLRIGNPLPIFETKNITSDNHNIWETRIYGAIINHGAVTAGPFVVGETIVEKTLADVVTGLSGTITALNASSVTYDTIDNMFTDGYKIVGLTSGASAIITNHNTGAHSEYSYTTSSVLLSVGTVINQKTIRQTVRYFPYFSAFSQAAAITFDLNPNTWTKQTIMYGDDLNGIGFRFNGMTPEVFIRSNVGGSVNHEVKTRAEWNLNKLDGVDLTKVNILRLDFQWLGVGRVRIGFDINGVLHYVHEFNHASLGSVVYMRTPSLPIRYEIENIAAPSTSTNLSQICCSVYSEGGYTLPGSEFSTGISVLAKKAITTFAPLFAIRLKNEIPTGFPNRRTIRFLDIEFTAQTNNATIYLYHAHTPITVTGGTWVDVSSDSSVQINTGLTAISAHILHPVQQTDVLAGQAGKGTTGGITSEYMSNHAFISQNFESTGSQMFVIFALPETGTANISGHISFVEFE